MKHRSGILALAIALLVCGGAAAENSVLRQEGLFAIQLDNLTGTETHAMQLSQGDLLDINVLRAEGEVFVQIKYNDGQPLFACEDALEPGFALEIPHDGVYRLSVSGQGATGSVRIAQKLPVGALDDESAPDGGPYRLSYIQGSLGYMIEYDPDFLRFEQTDDGDFFIPVGDPREPSLSLTLCRGDLDAVVGDLLALDGAEALAGSVIDWKAARSVRFQAGDGEERATTVYTVVEVTASELIMIVTNYAGELSEEAAEKLDRMMGSIRFSY